MSVERQYMSEKSLVTKFKSQVATYATYIFFANAFVFTVSDIHSTVYVNAINLKSLRSENHTPVFNFLIEALGPISCKNLNKFSKKMSQNPISRKPFLDLAILYILYVTISPANRCHGKVNYVFKRHIQSL